MVRMRLGSSPGSHQWMDPNSANWMMHELVAKTHILLEIRLWSSLRSSNLDRWRKICDVFDLGSIYFLQLYTSSTNYQLSLDWDELSQSLPWYGALLNPAIEDNVQMIQYQTTLGMKPCPLIKDFDQIQHAHIRDQGFLPILDAGWLQCHNTCLSG